MFCVVKNLIFKYMKLHDYCVADVSSATAIPMDDIYSYMFNRKQPSIEECFILSHFLKCEIFDLFYVHELDECFIEHRDYDDPDI